MARFKWALIAVGAVLLVLFISRLRMSPEKWKAYDYQSAVEATCGKAMSDSALGSERRMTRAACDELMEEAKKRIRDAP